MNNINERQILHKVISLGTANSRNICSRYSSDSVTWPWYGEIRVTGTRVSGWIPKISSVSQLIIKLTGIC